MDELPIEQSHSQHVNPSHVTINGLAHCKVPFSSNCAKVLISIFARFSCLFLLGLCINIYILHNFGECYKSVP